MLGDISVRLQELRNTQEEELVTVVAASGMVDTTENFMSRRKYRGNVRWKWRMRREDWQVTGRGEYILGTNRHHFFNTGIGEAWMNTDHQMVLAVLQGEGSQRSSEYRRRKIFCPIKPQKVQLLTEGEAAFETLKGGVDRTQWPTKSCAPWISTDTWHLSDRRTALPRTGRAIATEARQLRRYF